MSEKEYYHNINRYNINTYVRFGTWALAGTATATAFVDFPTHVVWTAAIVGLCFILEFELRDRLHHYRTKILCWESGSRLAQLDRRFLELQETWIQERHASDLSGSELNEDSESRDQLRAP